MTTQLEHTVDRTSGFITTLSDLPASKIGPTLISIIHSAADGVIVIDASRHIVLVNHKIERLFGYSAEQLLEKPLDLLMPAHLSHEQRRKMERLTATRVVGRRAKVDLKGVHSDGEFITFQASISRVAVHGELYLAFILHDSSVKKHSSKEAKPQTTRIPELRKWAVSSQQANEVEKRRFSKKLYDDIGQRLSVLKLDLDWLENSLPRTDDCVPARVAQMQGLLDNVITLTKSMASALRPPMLDDFGLLPAVEWMAENFRKKTSITCTVEVKGVPVRLDDAVESAIFRVIQEGLSNIERHAQANNAKITFMHTCDRVDVMIRDDGIGMESSTESKPGCYGLIAMQERVFVLGGTISICNAEPHGVFIHASMPVEPALYTEPISDPPTPNL